MGFEVEWEHAHTVDYDLLTVGKIVLDHLKEDPRYYTKLRKVHRENPMPRPISKPKALLSALRANLPKLDEAFEEYADTGDSYAYDKLLQGIFSRVLGRDWGLSADFGNSAWLLDQDDIFLVEEDVPGEYVILKQIVDEDDGSAQLAEVWLEGYPAYAHDHRELIQLLSIYVQL